MNFEKFPFIKVRIPFTKTYICVYKYTTRHFRKYYTDYYVSKLWEIFIYNYLIKIETNISKSSAKNICCFCLCDPADCLKNIRKTYIAKNKKIPKDLSICYYNTKETRV